MQSFGRLHPTQKKLLSALSEHSGPLPSLRWLMRQIGIASPNTIAHHLEQLQRKGYLVIHDSGEFTVYDKPVQEFLSLPLYGNAACGVEEFFTEENVVERVLVPARMFGVGQDYFLVRARGDSMEPRIHDKDLLVVQPQQEVTPGAIMVVAVEDGVFAKQVFREGKHVLLHSLNSKKYHPRILAGKEKAQVIGVVRSILHSTINASHNNTEAS